MENFRLLLLYIYVYTSISFWSKFNSKTSKYRNPVNQKCKLSKFFPFYMLYRHIADFTHHLLFAIHFGIIHHIQHTYIWKENYGQKIKHVVSSNNNSWFVVVQNLCTVFYKVTLVKRRKNLLHFQTLIFFTLFSAWCTCSIQFSI